MSGPMSLRLSMIVQYMLTGCALAFTCARSVSAADKDDDGMVTRIVADWVSRRDALKVVRYEFAGRDFWPQGMYNDAIEPAPVGEVEDNPSRDIEGEFTRTVTVDFARNRHRFEWDDCHYDHLTGSEYRIRCLHVCDSKTTYSRIFENSGPPVLAGMERPHVDLFINRGRMLTGVINYKYLPLFLGHGIVTYGDVRVAPGQLLPPMTPAHFTHAGEEEFRGRRCVRLRTPKSATDRKEFWVDVERDSAVVQVIDDPGGLSSVLEVDYREVHGHWLVSGWTWRSFHLFDGSDRLREDARVEHIEIDPTVEDADFVVEATPGMYVEDRTSSIDPRTGLAAHKNSFYRVEKGGEITQLDKYLRPIEPSR